MPQPIDISIALEQETIADPPFMRPSITYTTHEAWAVDLIASFPGMTVDQLPERMGCAVEQINLSTHNGTHIDAPWHYHPTMDGGRRTIAIDEVPLRWFMQPGVNLDFRNCAMGTWCPPTKSTLNSSASLTLKTLEIVVVTRAGERYGPPDFVHSGCAMGRDATLHLASKGIRVVGTDGWSWDGHACAAMVHDLPDIHRDPDVCPKSPTAAPRTELAKAEANQTEVHRSRLLKGTYGKRRKRKTAGPRHRAVRSRLLSGPTIERYRYGKRTPL
ncbi:cyclase family protein [Pararobbsia alpina]|uniref:Kynurenine formamidase n=1 Tax=Pararobbsia alpina TaxID=621374 RepID=A0A6S7CEF9_9BURK|nr:cyclase family protein [Pararobbsia alpina]CAB3807499.1 Kynurenine formamidase [Pararobbsia alpina]